MINDHESKQLRQGITDLESTIIQYLVDHPDWLSKTEEAALRWALSFARLTKVRVSNKITIDLGHTCDQYRAKLFQTLDKAFERLKLNPGILKTEVPAMKALVQKERNEVLAIYGPTMTEESLDNAVRTRPLALVLGGGGGTAYVFVGAFQALEKANITPSVMAGSSMGAILGAYRALSKQFSLDNMNLLATKTTWSKIAQPFAGPSRFGVPSTFRLYLRDAVGQEFSKKDGTFLRLKDLAIPLKVCVAGLWGLEAFNESDLEKYANLLDRHVGHESIRVKNRSVINQILDFAQKPLKAIYLGNDALTAEFDVLDAIGFSSAIPGVFHYDILRDDPHMISLLQSLLEREGVLRLIDGGFVDNLPTRAVLDAVELGEAEAYDPFVLALDSFCPSLTRNWLFYPLMRFAMENSREGHELAHLSIRFKRVLSPVNFIPALESFHQAVSDGVEEIEPYLKFIKKILSKIPDPLW